MTKFIHSATFCLFALIGFFLSESSVNAASFPLNATYIIENEWTGGYQVLVTLKNTTSMPTTTWQATFTLPSGESLGSAWNGVYSNSGQQITVKNPTWWGGGTISAGGSTTFGFIVNRTPSGPSQILNLIAAANGTPTPAPVPAAPVLNPISASGNNYIVSWNSVSNATSYILQQDTSSSFSNPQNVAQGTMLSQSFSNVPPGTYYYRVLASNSSGNSPYSNTQSVTIAASTLGTPNLNSISNPNQSSSYTISWSLVSSAQGYNLQEATSSDFSNAATIFSGNATSYQVSGRSPGTYYYRIQAFAGSTQSAWSNSVSTTVSSTPPPPPATGQIVEGYWESWNSNDSINTIVNMKADVIDIAFMTFSSTGNHTFQLTGLDADQATMTQFIQAAHSAGKKVKISIGGATYGMQNFLQTTQDAQGMAQAVANFVNANNLDGVDYDIEDYPAANLQIALLQYTRSFLPNAIISYTPKSPASSTHPYDQVIQGGYQYFDYLSIMAYDYAPGYRYQDDVNALIAMGVPASKIVVGLMPGMDDVGVNTTLDFIKAAANFIIANGLKGIMFWDLNRDHENQTGLGVDASFDAAWGIIHP